VQESGSSHLMSHEDASQAIGPVQVPAALQPMLQLLPVHAMRLVHEPAPVQSIAHALARLQSIAAVHDPAPVHVTAHGMPGGHTTGLVQVPAAMQLMAHVPSGLQVPKPASAHTDGHTAAASIVRASGDVVPASTPSPMLSLFCAAPVSFDGELASSLAASPGLGSSSAS
jgi:hypothetical protein